MGNPKEFGTRFNNSVSETNGSATITKSATTNRSYYITVISASSSDATANQSLAPGCTK